MLKTSLGFSSVLTLATSAVSSCTALTRLGFSFVLALANVNSCQYKAKQLPSRSYCVVLKQVDQLTQAECLLHLKISVARVFTTQ